MTLLGSLPFLTLILACVAFAPRLGRGSLRRGTLRLALLWGAAAVLALELLSLFRWLGFTQLLALWGLAAAAMALIVFRRWAAWDLRRTLAEIWRRMESIEKALAAAVLAVLGITALVAWIAPPNTWDSLNYHMPRVAHWAQLEAVRHFPTGIEIQNSMPPGAEMLVLHTYVLAQSDQWVNFVAWFAMLGALIGVSLLARQLGLGRTGQWAAAAFAASLPTGIVQASSTMTDYVVGFFVVCVAVETLALVDGSSGRWQAALWSSIAAGLAILTKPVAFVYLLPFALFLGLYYLRQQGIRRAAQAALVAITLVVSLNFGHWARNAALYGNPISRTARIEEHKAPWLGGRALVSNLVRNSAMHAGTPSAHVNKAITLGVQQVHEWIGLEVNDPRTTATGIFKVRWASKNEDKATNPLHAGLIGLSLVVLLARRRWFERRLLLYTTLVMATWIAFSLLFKWQMFGGRYHVPFFVLMAPAVSVVASGWLGARWRTGVALLLLAASWPWLLQIKSRPLIPDPGESYVGSVLTTPREQLYFANGRYLENPYRDMVAQIEAHRCSSVRLRLPGVAAEYPLWALLDAPRSGVEIGWSVAGSPSAGIEEALPPPCAVICHDCPGGQTEYGDLELALRKGGYSLYLEPAR